MEETGGTIPDRLDPARAAVLWTLLGCEGDPPQTGDVVPALFHQIYFWDVPGKDETALDGHAKLGRQIPDLGLQRRMAAGGRVTHHAPLRFGIAAEKTTFLVSVNEKTGRSGKLAFVTLRHEIRQRGGLALTEDQDIVYRSEPRTDGSEPDPRAIETHVRTATTRRVLRFSAIDLFRFSALTMNGHRIHYDEPYAIEEGYEGLVVHGPLLAQCLARTAEDLNGPISNFQYRATAPLLAGQDAVLGVNGRDLWIERLDGSIIMTARSA